MSLCRPSWCRSAQVKKSNFRGRSRGEVIGHCRIGPCCRSDLFGWLTTRSSRSEADAGLQLLANLLVTPAAAGQTFSCGWTGPEASLWKACLACLPLLLHILLAFRSPSELARSGACVPRAVVERILPFCTQDRWSQQQQQIIQAHVPRRPVGVVTSRCSYLQAQVRKGVSASRW